VVDHPEKFGEAMKKLLSQRSNSGTAASGPGSMHRRGYHTMRQRPRLQTQMLPSQRRTLYLKQSDAFKMLQAKGIPTVNQPTSDNECLLAVSIDRSARQPCLIASPSTKPSEMFELSRRFPFGYGTDEATSDAMLRDVASHLNVGGNGQKALGKLVGDLVDIFMSKEAFLLETRITITNEGGLQVQGAKFGFDDAAFRSSGRQAEIHALRDLSLEVPEDVEAEKSGMIYVKLEGDGTLGTIVNGAGLAMNTVDALVRRGGHPANFMDTGGKATSETIKAGFKIVSSDPRVKAIFVNIFGGLTLGDMIARGVIMAFKDLDLQLPVVVRLRGTNEKEGQRLIQESGLKLDAYGKSRRSQQ